jgi:hypothetical protein
MSPTPVAASGVCTPGIQNWGEPRRNPPTGGAIIPCTSRLPVVWIKGDAHLSGGYGQGVLLIDGDLRLTGTFEFTGVVLVKGVTDIQANGAKITGTLMTIGGATENVSVMGGTPTIQYSSCAIAQALLGAAVARPLAERSWVQLY